MSTLMIVLLSIVGLVLLVGLIRVITNPPKSFSKFVVEITLLDIVVEIISSIDIT